MNNIIMMSKMMDFGYEEGKVVVTQDLEMKFYTSLKKLCKGNPSFSYSYLKGLKFPFKYKGYTIEKLKVN